MKMDLNQSRMIGLTMELDLKAREYGELCKKLNKLKEIDINPNDERLNALKDLFELNNRQIVEINRQLEDLKQVSEKVDTENVLFKNLDSPITSNRSANITIIKSESIFKKIWNKVRGLFFKSNIF